MRTGENRYWCWASFLLVNQAILGISVIAFTAMDNSITILSPLPQVTVVSCDMREWNAPEKADILVSELLGSFGDNELSPECLDGAQKFLKGKLISCI